jgi:hypothetical protein
VADVENGYANMVFPSVNEAIRAADEARTRRDLADFTGHFDAASERLADARTALAQREPSAARVVGAPHGAATTCPRGPSRVALVLGGFGRPHIAFGKRLIAPVVTSVLSWPVS